MQYATKGNFILGNIKEYCNDCWNQGSIGKICLTFAPFAAFCIAMASLDPVNKTETGKYEWKTASKIREY